MTLGIACLFAPTLLAAQDYMTPACRGVVPAESLSRFDDSTHLAWYRRFWSGRCDGLSFLTCRSGDPNWNAVTAQLAAQASVAERPTAMSELCKLGHTVGLEWARDNSVRRISTADLRRLTTVLMGMGPLEERLQRANAQVRLLLSRPR